MPWPRLPQRLRRLFSSRRASGQLTKDATSWAVIPIGQLRPHELGTAQGTVAMLTMNPRSGRAWLEAELHDPTGNLKLIWMGRRVIPGILPGVKLRVHGRISMHEGGPAVFNPAYEIVAD